MKFSAATLAAISVILATPVQAGTITTFAGRDDGAAIGSGYTNSLAAQASFLAAASALGTVDTHQFGSQTLGASSGTFLNGDGTWTTTQPTGCCTN